MAELYKVNAITKRVRLLPSGEFVEVYEVVFTTKSGVSSSIEIPTTQFSTVVVKQKLEEEAKKIEETLSL